MMASESKLSLIDVGKFFFSIMVVALHTSAFSENEYIYNFMGKYIQALAVPFFFICSGFFLGRKLSNCTEKKEYRNVIKQYGIRLLHLYIVWAVINFPLRILENIMGGKGVVEAVKHAIHYWIVSQPGGGLWYIQAILILLIIILILHKKIYRYIFMCMLFVMYFIPMTTNTLANNSVAWAIDFTEKYNNMFITERNFLFYGFYFILGICLYDFIGHISKKNCLRELFILFCAFGVDVWIGESAGKIVICTFLHLLMRIIVVVMLFIILCRLTMIPKDISLVFRNLSVIIYFSHYLARGAMQFLLKDILSDTWIFVITILILLIYSAILLKYENKKYIYKFRNFFYDF